MYRKTIRHLLPLIIILTIFVTQANLIKAESPGTNIHVDHIAGGLEKVQEKITLFFKFNSTDKAKYEEFLANKRLAELKYIIDNNLIDYVEEVGSRYETYIGSLTNFVVDKKVISEKDNLFKMYSDHQKILEEISKKFEHDSGWWLVIQHDININKISADRVRKL